MAPLRTIAFTSWLLPLALAAESLRGSAYNNTISTENLHIDPLTYMTSDLEMSYARDRLPVSQLVPPTFDRDTAVRNVKLAESSYCNASAISGWSCASCVSSISGTVVVSVSDRYLQAYVAHDTEQGTIIVSFRGTEDVKNWLANIDTKKKNPYSDYPDASVHSGFYNDWAAIRDSIEAAIAAVRASESGAAGLGLTFVGHSLGAALATLGAFDLLRAGYAIDAVWTAGSPRVGDDTFAATATSLFGGSGTVVHRITHYHDIVPHTPEMLLGFRHMATEFWADEPNVNVVTCDGTGEDDACSNSCSPLSCTSIDDHLDYLDVTMGVGGC